MFSKVLLLSTLVPATLSAVPIGNTGLSLELVNNYTGLAKAGYAFLSEQVPGTLVLSRFDATPIFGHSQVTTLDLATGKHQDLATNIDWPNEANIVGEEVFGFKAAIVGSGFLVPSHTTGGIWVVELSPSPKTLTKGPVKITKDKNGLKPDSGYFYHKGQLMDMNGDGLLDIVTSRCAFSVFPWNDKKGEMIWLEHPKTGALSGKPWAEHFVHSGPDFLFSVAPPSVAGKELGVCAAEYINKQLSYVHGTEATGYSSRTLDSELGNGFGCTWADINGDGKLDIVATNHLNQNGSVFAYSWSGDLADNATVVHKHVLATGFSAISTAQGTASPGDAIPFFPKASGNHGKPLVLVSGDNGNYFSVLVPKKPSDPDDWTYTNQVLEFVGADVGRIAIGDTDGDGYNELFVPAYDLGQVVHYKIQASKIREDAHSNHAIVV